MLLPRHRYGQTGRQHLLPRFGDEPQASHMHMCTGLDIY